MSDIDTYKNIIDTLVRKGVFDIKNGSAEIFFDDIGELQEIRYRNKRRRKTAETLKIFDIKNGTTKLSYDPQGILMQIDYETVWKKKTGE